MILRDYLRIARGMRTIVQCGLLADLAIVAMVTWLSPHRYSARVHMYVSVPVGADNAVTAHQGSLYPASAPGAAAP